MKNELGRTAIAVSNTSKMSVGKIIKSPPLQECKTKVLFCLIAQEAPALLQQLTDQTVNASNSAMLECQARGIPEPQISWFKNHEEIHQEPGESFVYSPTSSSRLFVYPSTSGSHFQSHWHQYPGVRKVVRHNPGAPGYSVSLQNMSQAGDPDTTGLYGISEQIFIL